PVISEEAMFVSDRVLACGRHPITPRARSLCQARRPGWPRVAATLLATTSLLALGAGAARAGDAPAEAQQAAASNEVLLRKLEAMDKRIRMLEGQLRQANSPAPSPAATRAASAHAVRTATGPYAEAAPPADAKATPTDAKIAPATPGDARPTPVSAPTTPTTPTNKPILGLADSPIPGLSIGAYGEFFFGAQRIPAAGGQWQTGFDARRFVLLPVYQITDNIIFNAEIEFEHAGSGFDNDDKLHG